MGGRRARRQDPRHRRPRPHRQARRPAGPRLRHEARRLRPVRRRPTGPGSCPSTSSTSTSSMQRADFVTLHLAKTKETVGLIGADLLAKAKPGIRIVNVARGGIVDEDALADAIRGGTVGRRRPRRLRRGADHRVAAVRARRGGRHPAPRRLHPRGPGQGGRHDRRHGAARPRRRLRALRRQRRRPPRRPRPCARSCRWPSGSAGSTPRSPARLPARLEIEYQGQLADYDTRILTLSVLKGVFGAVDRPAGLLRQRPADRRGARRRGVDVVDVDHATSTSTSSPCAAATTPSPAPSSGPKGEPAHHDDRRPRRRPAAGPQPARRPQRRPAGDDRRRRDARWPRPASTSTTCTSATTADGAAAMQVLATTPEVPGRGAGRPAHRRRHRSRCTSSPTERRG